MMLHRLFGSLKNVLPAAVSYRLRIMKALRVDPELRRLRDIARNVGAKDLVALDVGANAGIYAAVLASHFGQVICFEPNPACNVYLRKVLPKNCLLVEVAASNGKGTVDLTIPVWHDRPETTRGTISRSNPIASSGEVVRVTVPMDTLDNMIASLGAKVAGRVALLKVDVEGHELEVFEGAAGLLSTQRPVVVAEIETRHGAMPDTIFHFFSARSYSFSAAEGDEPVTNRVFVPA